MITTNDYYYYICNLMIHMLVNKLIIISKQLASVVLMIIKCPFELSNMIIELIHDLIECIIKSIECLMFKLK